MASIKDVAKLAGVSIATVSRYMADPDSIREKNRQGVAQAIATTGYAPNTLAQNFRRGKTSLVLVILPDIGDPFFTDIMEGISRVAKELKYSILIRETGMNTLSWDDYSAMILSKQADGIILLASICPFTPAADRPEGAQQVPIVLSCENVTPELGQFPSVRIDNVRAARDATNHLLALGHENIAFISGLATSTLTADREEGYRQAIRQANPKNPAGRVVEGGLCLDGARRATRELLSDKHPPTAIFCSNDEMAMGSIHEIKAANLRVPEDISVIGFDGIRYAEIMDPPLTTIVQPAREIGEKTMRRLARSIAGENIGSGVEIVPHELKVRSSTCPPPAT
ncbi:MAG: LacI family DNA-binding transcriptional regulator [Halioglobus sp.]